MPKQFKLGMEQHGTFSWTTINFKSIIFTFTKFHFWQILRRNCIKRFAIHFANVWENMAVFHFYDMMPNHIYTWRRGAKCKHVYKQKMSSGPILKCDKKRLRDQENNHICKSGQLQQIKRRILFISSPYISFPQRMFSKSEKILSQSNCRIWRDFSLMLRKTCSEQEKTVSLAKA